MSENLELNQIEVEQNNLRIREYRECDCEEIWQLNSLAFESEGGLIDPFDQEEKRRFFDKLNKVNNQRKGIVLVGTINNQIITMGAIQETADRNVGEIIRIRTHPKYRKKGYASLIIQALEENARRLGYQKLVLGTANFHKEANNLYKKMGFILVKETPLPQAVATFGGLSLNYRDLRYKKILSP